MLKKACVALVVLAPFVAFAQQSNLDQQKIAAIEQKFVSISNFNSPEMSEAMQKYLYDGTTSAVGEFGRLYRMPKSAVVDLTKKPDATDPDVRITGKISEMRVDVFGNAALASYKEINTESGHKDATLDGDYSLTCLDSFVKRKGNWFIVGTACVPAAPISQAQWDAVMKMRAAEKQ